MHSRALLICLLIILLIASTINFASAWTTVGNGIEYQQFTVSGPNNVFVTRMTRSNLNATIDTCLPLGKCSGATEIVRYQAERSDDAIGYWGQTWGQRNDVIVAVNGDFWNVDTKVMTGGQIMSGWYCNRFWNYGSDSGFAWTLNRVPFIGECVYHIPDKNYITFTATGNTIKFKDINVPRGSDELIIYTPQYDSTTLTDNTGVEVLVEMQRPALILPAPAMAKGIVKQIRQNAGSTPIPFDCVVFSASGTAASNLLSKVSLGAEIGITQEIQSFGTDCATPLAVDWTKTYASIGGNFTFLRDSQIMPTSNEGLIIRNPRTAIAYNSTYIYFIVVDGRDPGISVGMNMTELANFCLSYLQATHGINNDGGGSSTMVVNGVVKNKPSDGWERAVANGIMMVNVLPKQTSTKFAAGQAVMTTTSANLRLGPGTNYASLSTVGGSVSGTIVDHSLKGIYAKGYYWWKVDFNGTAGWVAETLLASASTPPVITTHPSPQTVCFNGTATFSVEATSATPMSYQWQKGTANIGDLGSYSGTTTDTLTISNVSSSILGDYRCIVTNASGSTASNSAALSFNQNPPGSVTVSDEGAYTPSLTTLKATWTTTTNACGQPVSGYEYAIGTSTSVQDVKVWTSSGTSNSVTASGLSLQEGNTYYIQVRARDGGLTGPASASNGITAAPAAASIGQALAKPDGEAFSLRDKVVTGAFAGVFWLEETDRSAAVKVVSSTPVTKGKLVSAAGTLGISGIQRVFTADVVHDLGTAALTPSPVGMVQKDSGGDMLNSSTPGVTGGYSLYNVGLLVRIWGNVTHSDSSNPSDKIFYLDDGSGLSDGGPYKGIKIKCGNIVPPVSGTAVVTGIVGIEQAGGGIVPIILIRDNTDISML